MSRAVWICLHGVPRGGVTGSVRASTPGVEQIAKICAVDETVAIEITRGVGGRWSPLREDDAEICTIDLAIG